MLKISKNSALTDIVSDATVLPYIDNVTSEPTIDPITNETKNASNPAYNPITTPHPITGSSQSLQLWLFNDDITKTYKNITIDPTDTTSTDESSWIQLAPDSSGVAGTYLSGSVALSVADITTANVGTPFWYKCTTPSGQTVQNKSDIKLTVNYTEYAV